MPGLAVHAVINRWIARELRPNRGLRAVGQAMRVAVELGESPLIDLDAPDRPVDRAHHVVVDHESFERTGFVFPATPSRAGSYSSVAGARPRSLATANATSSSSLTTRSPTRLS